MAYDDNNLIHTSAKVLGPDGRPWQDEQGVDHFAIPKVYLFNATQGTWQTYFHGRQDDAIKNDPEFALAMPRDPHLMALVQERTMATATKRWEVQVGDKRNPAHKAISSSLKTIIEHTPRLMSMTRYLLAGSIWAGRYGAELAWGKKWMTIADADDPTRQIDREVPYVEMHSPVNGDKIGHHHDGTPYVQIHSTYGLNVPNAAMINTTQSRALLLKGTFRRNFILHLHEMLDADFRYPDQADMIHGVGVRHYLFWISWLKKNLLADIMQFVERTGLGVKLWKYQLGNKQSETEVMKAASESGDQTNLVIPVSSNTGRPVEGVEILDTSSGGAAIFERLIAIFDTWTERFVVGQTLSGGTGDSGLNGSGVADLHANTKFQLTSFDAVNLAETYTMDLARPLLAWCYPKFANLPCRFVFTLINPNVTEILAAASEFYELGGSIVEDELRETIGFAEPQEGDRVLSLQNAMQQQAQMQQQMMPQQGQPGQQQSPDDYSSLVSALTQGGGSGNQGEQSTAIA